MRESEMAELEIHHEGGHATDPMGQRVGILAAILAVLLAIVSIASHRTHTAAIMHKASANDAWAHYQAVRVKYHSIELSEDLVRMFGNDNPASAKVVEDYEKQKKKYEDQGREIQHEAETAGHA